MKEVATFKDISGKRKTDKFTLLPILAFFLTFLLIFGAFTLHNIAPIGEYSILQSDLKAQYAPNLLRLKHQIAQIDTGDLISSFTYDKTLGAGKNFMATFGYYMASPLNFLVLLFDEASIGTCVTLLIALKMSFASAFTCLFLYKRIGKKDYYPFVFALTYPFTSYAIIYMFNIIWLDGFALLPLLLYFIENYMEKKSRAGIIVTLIVLFVANFYAAYMVGVFSFFYIVYRYVYKVRIEKVMKAKEAVKGTFGFILLAVIGVFAVGVLLIPTGLNVLENKDVLTPLEASPLLQFKVIDLVDQIFLGNVGKFDNLSENLPYIFISMSVTSLIAIFFVSKAIERKDKIYYGIAFLFMFVSFFLTFADIMWQAFDTPNWFCHRFAFVFLPVFYVIALKTFGKIREVTNKELLKAGLILLVLLIVAQSFGDLGSNDKYFLMNLVLIAFYMLFFAGFKITKWPEQLKNMGKMLGFFMSLFIVFETFGLGPSTCDEMSSYVPVFKQATHENYVKATINAKNAAAPATSGRRQEIECTTKDDVFPVESSFEAGSLAGNAGIGIFDSSSNKSYARFLKNLGQNVNYNYFSDTYRYTSLPVDAFFSIGSVSSLRDIGINTKVLEDEATGLKTYANNDVFDIGFAVSKQAFALDMYKLESRSYSKNYFTLQNEWYRSMFPEAFASDIYKTGMIDPEDVTAYNASVFPLGNFTRTLSFPIQYDDKLGNEPTDITDQTRNTFYRNSDSSSVAVVINYKAPATGEQYLELAASRVLEGVKIYVKGEMIANISSRSYFSDITRLGRYNEGDDIEVTLVADTDVFSYLDIFYATLDEAAFREAFANVDKSGVTVTRFDNGHVGFTTNLKEGEILMTSIPYEKGWTCYVDGKKADIVPYQDAFIAVNCGTGEHNVELKFVAPGLKAGAAMTVVGILAIAALGIWSTASKRKTK